MVPPQYFPKSKGEPLKTCPQCDTGYPDSQTTCPTHGLLLNEIRDFKPGMVIHKTYRIVRKLGQGGMGTVYLAQHIHMGEPRALKFLSPELSRDAALTSRFLREVRTLRQVHSRNVVDCGDLEAAEDDSLFFSMEFVDGPDLRAFLHDSSQYLNTACHPERSVPGSPATGLRRWGGGAESKDLRLHSADEPAALYQGTTGRSGLQPRLPQTQQNEARALAPAKYGNTEGGGGFNPRIKPTELTRALAPEGSLPVPLALSIARQIAEGLGAAHAKGMVHRDIKPENILMKRDAGAWLPKIADFGIVATKESSTAYTRTGGTLLTMNYAAPEQWRGTPAASLDGRTDLYALGGLLYEMLTGQTPFHAENYEGWARQHQTTPPQPPSALRPDLASWQGLDALTLRLLAKDREDRPKDVAELVGLLDAVRYLPLDEYGETEIEGRTDSLGQKVAGTSPKIIYRWGIWNGLLVGGFILAVLTILFGLHRSQQKMNSVTQTPPVVQTQPSIADIDKDIAIGSKACDEGDRLKCDGLGYLYESGSYGVVKDIGKARQFYRKSCSLGGKLSCDTLKKWDANEPKPASVEEAAKLTWTDPVTGLTWTKKDNGGDVTWQQATDYCRNLQLAGHSGWRLATIDELQGIYDPNANVNGHDHVKGNLQLSGWEWSSTQYNVNASRGAWAFGFSIFGQHPFFLDDLRDDRALCVRGSANQSGSSAVKPASVVPATIRGGGAESEALTWTDPATRMMWTKKDNGSDVTWQQATNYCRKLQLVGQSNWRLATIDELQGIYDPNTHVKGNIQLDGWEWSSSPGNESGEAWIFLFLTGKRFSFPFNNSNNNHALCVRGPGQ